MYAKQLWHLRAKFPEQTLLAFVLNLAAKALDLTIPLPLLGRADEVIRVSSGARSYGPGALLRDTPPEVGIGSLVSVRHCSRHVRFDPNRRREN